MIWWSPAGRKAKLQINATCRAYIWQSSNLHTSCVSMLGNQGVYHFYHRYIIHIQVVSCDYLSRSKHEIEKHDFLFFLTGGVGLENTLQNPASSWLLESSWDELCRLSDMANFKGLRWVCENSWVILGVWWYWGLAVWVFDGLGVRFLGLPKSKR